MWRGTTYAAHRAMNNAKHYPSFPAARAVGKDGYHRMSWNTLAHSALVQFGVGCFNAAANAPSSAPAPSLDGNIDLVR